jgi:hypothetical protein
MVIYVQKKVDIFGRERYRKIDVLMLEHSFIKHSLTQHQLIKIFR